MQHRLGGIISMKAVCFCCKNKRFEFVFIYTVRAISNTPYLHLREIRCPFVKSAYINRLLKYIICISFVDDGAEKNQLCKAPFYYAL